MDTLPKPGTYIDWHAAFIQALQAELEAYLDVLEFYPEFPLTAEPLRIDCVVVKKVPGVVIKKNIAAIFREWNLLEYKSPGDYVSVADFYKVYGYACLYTSLKNIPVNSLTISFVESRYPKKLLAHLRRERGYTIAENSPGIYTIQGDILPIQIIDSRKLSVEENIWLKSLSNRLSPADFELIRQERSRQGKAAQLEAYIDVIARANTVTLKEALSMGRKPTLEEVLEEAGLLAEWKDRGRAEERAESERKAFVVAQNLINLGLPFETVVSATELDPGKVKAMYVSESNP